MDILGVLIVPIFWTCITELFALWTICAITGCVLEVKIEESEVIWLQQAESKYNDLEVAGVTDRTCEVDLLESGWSCLSFMENLGKVLSKEYSVVAATKVWIGWNALLWLENCLDCSQ